MPSTIADESPDGGQTSPESRIGRLSAWLSGHPLHIEAAVAAAAIGLTIVAIPFLSFGIFVALEGETAILAIGVAFIAGSLLSVVGLAVTVVGHTYSDIRQHGFPTSAELDLQLGGLRWHPSRRNGGSRRIARWTRIGHARECNSWISPEPDLGGGGSHCSAITTCRFSTRDSDVWQNHPHALATRELTAKKIC
jgi:hypothetical protein